MNGASEIGIGHLVGANIAHVFLILGATAVAGSGIVKGRGMGWKFNTAAMAGTTLLFGGLLASDSLTPAVGIGMTALAAAYLGANYWINKKDAALLKVDPKTLFHSHGDEEHHHHSHNMPGLAYALMGAAGIGGLAYGAHLAVQSGSNIALNAAVDPAIVGTLGVALGVSLPELIFSVRAARKGNTQMAVGNILGCNIFNILAVGSVLSLANTAVPESFSTNSTLGQFNLAALLTSAGLMSTTMIANKGGVKKWQGGLGLALYLGYVATNISLGGYKHEDIEHSTSQIITAQNSQSIQQVRSGQIRHRFSN
jgi:cation:H+ antiporter